MPDHQPSPVLQRLDNIIAAREAGVPWTDLGDLLPPPDPGQLENAYGYLHFRSGLEETADRVTVERGARILRAGDDAEMTERVWGLAPGDTDFGDLATAMDQVAEQIHRPADFRSSAGRHEAPRGAGWPVADHGNATVYEVPEGLGS